MLSAFAPWRDPATTDVPHLNLQAKLQENDCQECPIAWGEEVVEVASKAH